MLSLAGTERMFDENQLIVSKTDTKGRITYANDVFLDVADFSLKNVLNEPHSMIRNEAMPRCIFQLLWEYLQDGREIFAYVVNATKHNDHYWVLAHVTPSYDAQGDIISYHSNRRVPSPAAVSAISDLYGILLAEEKTHTNRKEGQKAGYALLHKILTEKGIDYDEFVLSL